MKLKRKKGGKGCCYCWTQPNDLVLLKQTWLQVVAMVICCPLGFNLLNVLIFIGWSWTRIWKNTREELRNFWRAKPKLHFGWPNLTQTFLHFFYFTVCPVSLGNQHDEPKWHSYTQAHMWLLPPPPPYSSFPFSGWRPWRPLHHWRVASWRAGLHPCWHSDSIVFLTHKKTPTQYVLCMSIKLFAFCEVWPFCGFSHPIEANQSSEFLQNMSTDFRF